MAPGTYPRDSISLEERGKSQEKGDGGGANPVAQLSRDPDQTFGKSILAVTHFLLSAVCQTCGTLRTSPRLAVLRGEDRWGGAGPRPASRLQACQALLLLEGEEPPAAPPGAPADGAAGGRVGQRPGSNLSQGTAPGSVPLRPGKAEGSKKSLEANCSEEVPPL